LFSAAGTRTESAIATMNQANVFITRIEFNSAPFVQRKR
jgi:hypothetical protein